jgi:peptidoglycan/LPS O-acetylase OafA/YrhL
MLNGAGDSLKDQFSFSRNNFDLLRLLAALQVAFVHGVEHLDITISESVMTVISAFPGVPIFFVISGFLISASWERSTSVLNYSINRFLRIYPALWGCLLVSIIMVSATSTIEFNSSETIPWLVAQTTIGQFYNPEFLRTYGVGVLNGSLWTIPVELQFYLALPFIYALLKVVKIKTNFSLIISIISLSIVSIIFNTFLASQETLITKLLGVSLIPYLYMFLIGVILQKNRDFVAKYLAGNAIKWLIALLTIDILCELSSINFRGNSLNPVSATTLSIATVAMAYTKTNRFSNVLQGNDISYGLYIYHMLIVNLLIELGMTGNTIHLSAMLVGSALAAMLSWRLIEKPALKLKPASLRRQST